MREEKIPTTTTQISSTYPAKQTKQFVENATKEN